MWLSYNFPGQRIVTWTSEISPLTRCSASKRFAKCQVTDDIEGTEIVPFLHIAWLLGAMSVKLTDHHVDEVVDQVLLLG